ncbi:hypothetical protein NPIL_151861 [Nephila pilipes]|uniref:Uncharacterized protein n=1 Tax=Nephila pilipes TaxID=299642 RepID=A0A8X6P667_NEPPI|nr:hypothetical protein NPIL_151861 [Nephila pilipes]
MYPTEFAFRDGSEVPLVPLHPTSDSGWGIRRAAAHLRSVDARHTSRGKSTAAAEHRMRGNSTSKRSLYYLPPKQSPTMLRCDCTLSANCDRMAACNSSEEQA